VDDSPAQPTAANALGLVHIAFEVEDIEAVLATLQRHDAEPISSIYRYEDSYRLCYIRGPEGVIIELAEAIS
jgi:catechol 2,3-dioxygenase-like lactoylglutathione lyase family enzyme